MTSDIQIRNKRIGDFDAIRASAVPMRVDTHRRQLGWGRTYGAWRRANTGQGQIQGQSGDVTFRSHLKTRVLRVILTATVRRITCNTDWRMKRKHL